MADRTVRVRIRGEVASFVAALRAAGRETERFADRVERSTGRLPREVASHRQSFARAGEQLGDGVASGYRKRVVEVERATEKVARRSNTRFRVLVGAILAGLPAASSAAIGVATAGAAAGFIGLGAVALRENEKVKASFRELGATVSSDLAEDAAVMEDAFVGAAGQMGASFQELRPLLRDGFSASAPHIETLIDGVTDFARNAMPGMITALERADPVMEGLSSLLASTGQGVGDFFDIVSQESDDVGRGLENVGALFEGFLTGTANVLVPLSALWAEVGDEVAEAIEQILTVVGGLAGSALPVLGSALGSALDVLSGVLDVLEPISDVLGVGIGLWLTYAATIRGLTAVQGVLAGLATSMKGVRTASIGMLGPIGLLIAGGMALGDAFSDELDASELKAMDEHLTGLVDKGKAQEAADQFRAWAAVADMLGVSFEEFKAQMPGYTTAMEGVKVATDGTVSATGALQGQLKAAKAKFDEARTALEKWRREQLLAVDPVLALNDALERADEAQQAVNKAIKEHGPNSAEAEAATWDLVEAVSAAEQAATDGDLSFGDFKAKLQTWVGQGRITQRQADTLARRVKNLTGEAEDFRDDYVSRLLANDRQAKRVVDSHERRLNALHGKVVNTFIRTYLQRVLQPDLNQGRRPSDRPPGIPFAEGGRFARGTVAIVGEEGPEIVRFDGSGEVIPHRESMRMLERETRVVGSAGGAVIGSAGGGMTVINKSVTVHVPNYVGSRDELTRTIRKAVRTEGHGDVQAAFGQ